VLERGIIADDARERNGSPKDDTSDEGPERYPSLKRETGQTTKSSELLEDINGSPTKQPAREEGTGTSARHKAGDPS
jgi:hypothetical protein